MEYLGGGSCLDLVRDNPYLLTLVDLELTKVDS